MNKAQKKASRTSFSFINPWFVTARSNSWWYLILFGIGLLGTSCEQKSQEPPVNAFIGTSVTREALDHFIDEQMAELAMPALSLAIINDENVVYHTARGYTHITPHQRVDTTSVFEGASLSKSVFSYFVLTLVDDKILDLDQPLYTYAPHLKFSKDERYKKITARMVLSHRAGFSTWFERYPTNSVPIFFEPGAHYHYSGVGYQYLAEVLKELLDTDWEGLEAVFQKRVAIPLALKNTTFIPQEYNSKHSVQSVSKVPLEQRHSLRKPYKIHDSVFVAPASIRTNAADFSRWMIAVMQQKGLSPVAFQELFAPQAIIDSGILKKEYTLGMKRLSLLNVIDIYSHSGNTEGFTSGYIFNKRKKWGFVYFTNSETGEEFALHLVYRFLLFGSTGKLIALCVAIVLSLFLLILNLKDLVNKRLARNKLQSALLQTSAVVFVSLALSLGLAFIISHTLTPYLYVFFFLSTIICTYVVLRLRTSSLQNTPQLRRRWYWQMALLGSILVAVITFGLM